MKVVEWCCKTSRMFGEIRGRKRREVLDRMA